MQLLRMLAATGHRDRCHAYYVNSIDAPRSSSRSRPAWCALFGCKTARRLRPGDVLIELDPTVNAAERDHLRNDLLAEQLNIARLRAALAGGDDPVSDFAPPADADQSLISSQRQLLGQSGDRAPRQDRRRPLRQQAQKEAEQATTAATIRKLETLIPVIQPRVDIRKTLMDKELGSKLTSYGFSSC